MGIFNHENIIIRFIRLSLIGLVLLYLAWTIGYLFLPEGVFKGIGVFGKIAGDTFSGSIGTEFMTIFGINLIGFLLIVLGNLILRVRYFGFGSLIPLAWMALYGLILGTNSFLIPLEARLAPSLEIFLRSGLYEMMAGILMAVSTTSIAFNVSDRFTKKSRPVPVKERISLKREQWIGALIAIIILAAAAYRKAFMIMNSL